jgi:hypothetical protein
MVYFNESTLHLRLLTFINFWYFNVSFHLLHLTPFLKIFHLYILIYVQLCLVFKTKYIPRSTVLYCSTFSVTCSQLCLISENHERKSNKKNNNFSEQEYVRVTLYSCTNCLSSFNLGWDSGHPPSNQILTSSPSYAWFLRFQTLAVLTVNIII